MIRKITPRFSRRVDNAGLEKVVCIVRKEGHKKVITETTYINHIRENQIKTLYLGKKLVNKSFIIFDKRGRKLETINILG